MNIGLVTGFLVVAAVVIVIVLMRSMSGSGVQAGTSEGPGPTPDEPETIDEVLESIAPDEDTFGEAVAITSDGWAFVPDGEEVQLVPPGDPEDLMPVRSTEQTGYAPSTDPDIQALAGRGAPVDPRTGRRLSAWKPGEHLDVGDFVAARVQRGAPGVDPWRLEVLRRDRDYHSFSFETREGAEAALTLVETRIVRPPRDEHGDPIVLGADDFEAARRDVEEIEAELAAMPDLEDERDRT